MTRYYYYKRIILNALFSHFTKDPDSPDCFRGDHDDDDVLPRGESGSANKKATAVKSEMASSAVWVHLKWGKHFITMIIKLSFL